MTPLLTGVFASQISGHLNTFTPTGSYDAITSYTVPAGGVSTITFSGIPSGYKHLQIRGIARSTVNDQNDAAYITLNNDSSSIYAAHYMEAAGGGSVAAYAGTSMSPGYPMYMVFTPGAQISSGVFGTGVVDILDYNSTSKTKVLRSLTGSDFNGGGRMYFSSALYNSTNAINSIKLTFMNGSFAQHSQFALYGVKG